MDIFFCRFRIEVGLRRPATVCAADIFLQFGIELLIGLREALNIEKAFSSKAMVIVDEITILLCVNGRD
jgi:hypothetical protein